MEIKKDFQSEGRLGHSFRADSVGAVCQHSSGFWQRQRPAGWGEGKPQRAEKESLWLLDGILALQLETGYLQVGNVFVFGCS